MNMLTIVKVGEDILKKKAAVIPEIDETVRQLAEDMLETLGPNNGVGLAGPQVGVSKRIFVSSVPEDKPRVFINPEIIETSPEQIAIEEGCLSIPGVYADVVRSRLVKVQAYDINGKPFVLHADGLLARVVQHEIDHLNGVLFIDHLPEKKRLRAMKSFHRTAKS